jgi:hypothetical protein
MKIAKDIFKCVVVANLVVYFAFAAAIIIFQPSREASHRLASVFLGSWLLLFALSAIFLFLDRRAAGRGFLVLLFGFIVGALFPEL